MKKTLLLTIILFFTRTIAWTYPSDYGPFELNAIPKTYSLKECVCISGADDKSRVFAPKKNSVHHITVTESNKDKRFGYTVTMEDISGNVLLKPCEIGGYQGFSPYVYTALLNEDKEPDYLIITWFGGCGLAAGYSYLSFLLSCDNGFQLASVCTYYADETDFVDLNQDGKPELIHTAFDTTFTHNYWAYNLLQFEGTKIVSANKLDKRFPCWIWYKFKPNHKTTTQLASAKKNRL